jgi:hypothetical protein
VFLRILNRGVTLAGVALHFDARALTAARHVLEAAQRSARLGSTCGGLKKSHPTGAYAWSVIDNWREALKTL